MIFFHCNDVTANHSFPVKSISCNYQLHIEQEAILNTLNSASQRYNIANN